MKKNFMYFFFAICLVNTLPLSLAIPLIIHPKNEAEAYTRRCLYFKRAIVRASLGSIDEVVCPPSEDQEEPMPPTEYHPFVPFCVSIVKEDGEEMGFVEEAEWRNGVLYYKVEFDEGERYEWIRVDQRSFSFKKI